MNLDKLYALAFEYKKTKLWYRLYETSLFAIKLSDGRIGYVSIMGLFHDFPAVALYIGEEGLNSFFENSRNKVDLILSNAYNVGKNCLKCSFRGKDDLSEEKIEAVRAVARKLGVKIGGAHAYPQFEKHQKNRPTCDLQTEYEAEALCEALSACIWLHNFFKEYESKEKGTPLVEENKEEIPFLEKCEDGYSITKIQINMNNREKLPTATANNDIALEKLRQAKRSGVWQCGLVRYSDPIQRKEDEFSYFPLVFFPVEEDSMHFLPVPLFVDCDDNLDGLLNDFVDTLVSQNICPEQIKVSDKHTFHFLKDFCKKLEISLAREEFLSECNYVKRLFLDQIRMPLYEGAEPNVATLLSFLNSILNVEDEELKIPPVDLSEEINILLKTKILPEKLESKLIRLIEMKNDDNSEEVDSLEESHNESYVISVSLGTGCYRHIRISSNSKLLRLHEAILDAFNFDDDHAHAFFMDNKKWSLNESYYDEFIEDSSRKTNRYRLNQVGLYKGKPFKYVFDFGDEWTFQCKLMRIENKATPIPEVIKSVGEAPEQYDYDEDEYEDEDFLDADELLEIINRDNGLNLKL